MQIARPDFDRIFGALADATRRDIVRRAVDERTGLGTNERIGRRKIVRTNLEGLRVARRLLDRYATAIESDAIAGVRQLKAQHDGDLVMSGCEELAQELIQASLVDENLFWVHPPHPGPGHPPVRRRHGSGAAPRGEAVRLGRRAAAVPAHRPDLMRQEPLRSDSADWTVQQEIHDFRGETP
jgi:riboflavin biosynthesis pyrimidine reductase